MELKLPPTALRLRGIAKQFADRPILRGIDLQVRAGAVHFILGRSGAGKSLLVKGLVGLCTYDTGTVDFFATRIDLARPADVRRLRQQCQLVFQNSALFDELTVLQNVAMPLRQRDGLSAAAAATRAHAALTQVQAEHLAARSVADLGAGLQKRVAIARALALRPRLLLYDEPTTSLDPVSARRTDALMRTLAADGQTTQVVVSHDLRSTAEVATWVSFLHRGRVYFDGSPAAFLAASDDPVIAPFVRPPLALA